MKPIVIFLFIATLFMVPALLASEGRADTWDPLAENPETPEEPPSSSSPRPYPFDALPPPTEAIPAEVTPSVRPSSYWDHNGSTMYLVAQGHGRQFYYAQPRPAMLNACAQSGALLFDGVKSGDTYSGTASLFSCGCGTISYEVAGPVERKGTRVVLYGRAPRRDENCQITRYRDDILVFDYMRRY